MNLFPSKSPKQTLTACCFCLPIVMTERLSLGYMRSMPMIPTTRDHLLRETLAQSGKIKDLVYTADQREADILFWSALLETASLNLSMIPYWHSDSCAASMRLLPPLCQVNEAALGCLLQPPQVQLLPGSRCPLSGALGH